MGWEGDQRFSLAIQVFTNPGAGNDINFTPPTSQLWQVLEVRVFLTTGAAAGNRVPLVNLRYFSNGFGFYNLNHWSAFAQGPSLGNTYVWVNGEWGSLSGPQQFMTPLPSESFLSPGSAVNIACDGGMLPGDTLSSASMIYRLLD